VLVVRTEQGDPVADNLNANIRPWYQTRYRWVRVVPAQSSILGDGGEDRGLRPLVGLLGGLIASLFSLDKLRRLKLDGSRLCNNRLPT
jgi:Bacterial transglutaminase-like cysteine proteinase BTLCP